VAKGIDTGSHPRRQVGAGSGPWSQWTQSTYGVGPLAKEVSSATAVNRYDPGYPHALSVDRSMRSGKYEASYEHFDPGHEPGARYVSTYKAGTQFKSPERAKLAAEALSNRVTGYRGGSRNYAFQNYIRPEDW
jgi:hypothetical protein